MTITVSPARNEYTANAGQTIFNYTFKIFQNTDLNVYVTPADQDANDSTDLTTLYTVTGIGDEDGGSITLAIPTNANDLVTIVSNIPSSRTTDYQNNGDFRPNVVNNDFDRVVSLVKKVEDRTNRGLLLPESQQDPKPLSLPIPKAGFPVRWNGDASGLENYDNSTVSNEEIANDKVVINYPTLLAAQNDPKLKLNQACNIKERTLGNYGGGVWDVVDANTYPANGFDVVASSTTGLNLKLRVSNTITARQWGVIGGVDETVKIRALLESGYSKVIFDEVDLITTEQIEVSNSIDVEFVGGSHSYQSTVAGSRAFIFRSSIINTATVQLSQGVPEGQLSLLVDDATGFSVGDDVQLLSDESPSINSLPNIYKREWCIIDDITGNTITFSTGTVFSYTGSTTLTINKYPEQVVKIKGLKSVSNSGLTPVHCLGLWGCKDSVVERCEIEDYYRDNIELWNCIRTDVLYNKSKGKAADNLFEYTIVVYSSSEINIIGNTVYGTGKAAIDASASSTFINVVGNTLFNSRVGSHMVRYMNITGNTLHNSYIILRGQDMLVSGNVCENSTQDIMIHAFADDAILGGHMITGNLFSGKFRASIVASNFVMKNNVIDCNKASNISPSWLFGFQTGYSGGATIEGNEIFYRGDDPVDNIFYHFSGNNLSNTKINRNTIECPNDNVAYGVRLNSPMEALNIQVNGNTMSGVALGIRLGNADRWQVNGNTITLVAPSGTSQGIFIEPTTAKAYNANMAIGNVVYNCQFGFQWFNTVTATLNNSILKNNIAEGSSAVAGGGIDASTINSDNIAYT